MQASQLWLAMSPEDKMKFAHGEGIAPDSSAQDEVKQQLTNHSRDQIESGSGSSDQIQQNIPTPLGASLQSLPGLSGSSSPDN